MRAAYYERQGQARDVLVIGEVTTPLPAPGQVLVRIYVSGLNPTDVKARTGFSSGMAFARIIPHQDGAGIIESVGLGVSADRIGERVWIYEAQVGRPDGTAAEYVALPAHKAVPLPDGISFAVGATLGVPALTAHRCLFSDGAIHGRRVLIHGGAGAVGSAAIMLSKWAGAWVAATVRRGEHEAIARSAGADLVLNLSDNDALGAINLATGGVGVDRIVDVDIQTNLEFDFACLSVGGVISSYAMQKASDTVSVPLLRAMVGGYLLRFVYIYSVPLEAKQLAIEDITRCLNAGGYSPLIGLSLPLEMISDAHTALESGNISGRILLDVFEGTIAFS